MNKKPYELTASEAAGKIREGTLTSEELVASCLERIADREDAVRAWQYLDRDGAQAQARERDQRRPEGPLHGIPVGLKDIIDTSSLPTTYGSRAFQSNQPENDADCVQRLVDAGAVIMGKTVTTEFAFYSPGKTRNAHHPGYTPGGSSSGSAAAVADFHVPLALGTQTAGSIIRPAAYNGVVGYKPSFDEFSYQGIGVLVKSLDTLGGFTRDISDLTLLRRALAEQVKESVSAAKPPRIAVAQTALWEQAEPEMRKALAAFAAILGKAGADVAEMQLPQPFDALAESQTILLAVEAARTLGPKLAEHGDLIAPRTRALLTEAAAYDSDAYSAAAENIERCRSLMDAVFAECDLILTYAAPGEAPEGLEATGDPVFNRIWTAVRAPCISIPTGRGANTMPLGVQLVGPCGSDDELIANSAWVWERSDYDITPL
jgi:Asp-tRNA(Asn)/Glu-tRNA(Gln) amidotransferase A subunit family amidase